MFKSRSASQGPTSASAVPSVETLRRRARHRLIGASVLVLIGVVGFPLLFDTAPRPLTADVSIDIPARSTPALPAPQPPQAAAVAAAQQVPADQALDDEESVVTAGTPAQAAAAPAPKPTPTPKPQPVSKAPAAPAVAKAAPNAPEPPKKADDGAPPRLIVQVGAFADAQRAREVRLRLERAGLKTYTHVADTAEGQRIRVRLGPFSSRAEAEKAAARAKELGLPATILTL